MVPFPLVNLKTGGLFMNMEIPDIRAELADEFESANKSTGPRTPEGKQRSSQNARKHGFYGKHFYWEAMIALGEDPRDFRRMLRGLVAARHPADALEMALVEDIAMLYWKKQYLDSREVAVQALNLRKYDLERKKLSIQVLRGCDSNTSEYVACRDGLRNKLESPGQFEEVINRLWRVVTLAEDNDFSLKMKTDLLVVYGNDPTLRGGNLDTHYQLLKDMKPDHPKYEPLRRELIRSAMHEINDLVKEYRLYLDEYVQTTRVARVASMVPTEGQWPAIVRQQNALERLLERKIRLLMDLQEHRILYGAPAPGYPARSDPARWRPRPRDPAPQRDTALSRGERVARDGAFTSRRGSGEGSLHCHTHPAQNTENSRNELHDLLQSKALTTNDPSKRTGLFCPKRTAGWRKCRRVTNNPSPSCSAGRSGPPSPEGLGRGWPATAPPPSVGGGLSAALQPSGSGEGSLHCHTHPAQNTDNSRNELHDLLQSKALTTNDLLKTNCL